MNQQHKHKPNRNPKHLYYMHLLHTKEWQGVDGLRARTLRAHPLCEHCKREGVVTAAVDVHHIKPVEDVGPYIPPGQPVPEEVQKAMRQRCFDPANVVALCIPCHIEVHRRMRSHQGQMLRSMPQDTSEQSQALAKWVERVSGGKAQAYIPRKGLVRTPQGWFTPEELEQKQADDLSEWCKRVQNLGR